MWPWKRRSDYPHQPTVPEGRLTTEEMARLQALRQQCSLYFEYLLGVEERKLLFVRWLVQQGKLREDME
jgi:hypothetical protein